MNKNHKNTQGIGTFAVIFNDKQEVLLGQRNEPDATHPFHGKWSFPGGGVHFGEHPEDALKREVKEEVGIDIELLSHYPMVFSHVHAHPDESDQDFLLMYPAIYKSGFVNTENDQGTMDAQWFRFEDIDFNTCVPETKEVIEQAKEIIKMQKSNIKM